MATNNAYPLGIAVPAGFDSTVKESLDHAGAAGFTVAALIWEETDRAATGTNAEHLRKIGLTPNSIHGPFYPRPGIENGINSLWEPGERGDRYCETLLACLADASRAEIPLMVLHPNLAYYEGEVSPLALDRFAKIGAAAARWGVRIAVENMEMPHLYRALLDEMDPTVFGICWDVGHNNAYTPDFDPLCGYAGRVFTVHLHDNDGKRRDGAPDTADDAHFLPFDGTVDWPRAMAHLHAAGYEGPLLLEVKRGRTPCRNIPAYREMGEASFFAEAYARGLRLAALL